MRKPKIHETSLRLPVKKFTELTEDDIPYLCKKLRFYQRELGVQSEVLRQVREKLKASEERCRFLQDKMLALQHRTRITRDGNHRPSRGKAASGKPCAESG